MKNPNPAGGHRGRRRDVLETVRASADPLSILDIAERLGVHPNTVRFHLNVLVENGQVEHAEPTAARPGRPALLFRAPSGMDPAGPRNYRLLAEILAENVASQPDPAGRAIEAGRAWGLRRTAPTGHGRPDRSEAITRLMAMLDDLGFAPDHDPGHRPDRIGLRHCPFLEVASDRPQVICSLHLGLMEGTMDALDAPLTIEQLQPYAEPDLCLVHLGPPEPREGARR
jgi:predicted ArsR family transcriptional regulator